MTPLAPITILLAEDSALFAAVLREVLDEAPDVRLVHHVEDGEEAVEACCRFKPDLVLMDVQMPKLDGLRATAAIMARCPTPILIITSDPFRAGVDVSFQALRAGALDLYPKTRLRPGDLEAREELLKKIRLLSQIPVVRHVRGRRSPSREALSTRPPPSRRAKLPRGAAARLRDAPRPPIVGIVASTGGPRALATILGALPGDLWATLLIVQHITDGFTSHLARWLDSHSALCVSEAREREPLAPGHVLLAPAGHHLELDASLSSARLRAPHPSAPRRAHCPGGDELLSSLAEHAGSRSIGVILSGMGGDGAQGLLAVHERGGLTVTQSRESSVVWGMPRAALELGAADRALSPLQIASWLTALTERGRGGAR